MAEKILVVDDEATMVDIIRYSLEKEGYAVVTAQDGEEGLRMARAEKPDLVVLDIMLPMVDGYEVCRTLCVEQGMPIIMVTAKDELFDKVVGLEIGADDYLTKPFSPRELVARVRAQLRRNKKSRTAQTPTDLSFGELSISMERREVLKRSKRMELTPKEFDVLAHLVNNRNRVVTREQLLDGVWGYDFYGDNKIVNVTVARLREKVEDDPSHPRYVTTVRGAGYMFQEPTHEAPPPETLRPEH